MSEVETPAQFAADTDNVLPRLLVRNLLLGFITLGLYRFWATTALRRHFWSRISIASEPFEYIGNGRELFIGFLIVMAVFMPISIGYSILQTALIDSPAALSAFSALYSIAMFVLVQAAIYRARRYRLSRTVWRGIRAGQDGSTWRYIGLASIWVIPVLLSAGLLLPWAMASLARYRMTHTIWGDFRGRFTGTGGSLLKAWLPFWVIGIAGLALAGIFAPQTGVYQDIAREDPVFVYVLVGISGFALGYMLFQIAWLRWYLGHSELGPLRFSCSLRLRNVLFYVVPAILVPLLYAAVMIGLAFVVFRMFLAIHIAASVIAGLAAVMVAWAGLRILWTLVIYVPVMRRIVSSVSVHNIDAAAAATQSSMQPQRFGEGLADSFEIGIA